MGRKDLHNYLTSCSTTLNAGGFENDEMRQLFLAQVAGEIKGKEAECAADQRCSKILESLLGLGLDEDALGKWLEAFLAPEAFLELSCNQYSSHVIQTLLNKATSVQMQRGEQWQVLNDVLEHLHSHLDEHDMWSRLFTDVSATHVIRSYALLLAGYFEDLKTAKRGSKKKKGKKKKPDALPAVRHTELLFPDLFRKLIKHMWECLGVRDDWLALNEYAAPIAKLALAILRDRNETQLLREGLKGIIATKADIAAMATSGPGSHVLEEAVLAAGKSDDFLRILSFFRKSWTEVLAMKPGGVFAVDAVVKSLQDSAQVGLVLDGFPFAAAIGGTPTHQACAKSLVETCLRLRCHFKAVAHQIFVALGVQNTQDYKDAWPRLLCLRMEPDGVCWNGGGLTMALLQFPPDAVAPLVASFKVLKDMTHTIALDDVGTRVLEQCIGLDSCFDTKQRLKIIRRLMSDQELLIKLATSRGSAWLVSAMWKSAGIEPTLREELTKMLIKEEEAIRDNNIALWKSCECNAYKKTSEEWEEKQKKASKTQRVFEDIINTKTEERPTTVPALPRQDQGLAQDEGVDAQVAEEIENVFWTTRRRRKKGGAQEQAIVVEKPAETGPVDSDLADVLNIIGGVCGKRKKNDKDKKAKKRKFTS